MESIEFVELYLGIALLAFGIACERISVRNSRIQLQDILRQVKLL